MQELAPGLWRWTAPHPAWVPGAEAGSPDDWDQFVGSILYEGPDSAVFFDPLVPADEEAFWRWADQRARGRRVAVLTTITWHRRSRDRVAERYLASVSRARRNLPAGVEPIVLRGAAEALFWLPEHRALIPGDRILGAPGGELGLCPESWLRAVRVRVDRQGLRRLLEPVLELPIERVLVSHGEPILQNGADVLRRAWLAAG